MWDTAWIGSIVVVVLWRNLVSEAVREQWKGVKEKN